jgi:hypothetical protein
MIVEVTLQPTELKISVVNIKKVLFVPGYHKGDITDDSKVRPIKEI